jgi:hypothetical protein
MAKGFGIFGSFLKAGVKAANKSLERVQKQAERLQLLGKSTQVKAHKTSFNKDLYRPVVSGTNFIYASPIPKTVDMGNLIFEKKYEAAITLGKKLLSTCTNVKYESMIHVNLMQAYFKSRSENPKYFDLSTYHAKQAMICGHNTGFVQERLAINLEKAGKLNSVIELCEIILSDQFTFSLHGVGTKEEYHNRKIKILKKINRTIIEPETDELFNENERASIYENSKIEF